ncbi:MAG: YraN family protein [Holosporaceae bacterium]|jgi:putative endonuclease|nr:YraN family protein [Holosporaceae bacterium]
MSSTEYKGIFGELTAALLLTIKGYIILARRYKTSCGEIDIIARKGDVIAFVEVKYRKSLTKCYEAIRNKQIRRIVRASEIFLCKNPDLRSNFIRYDVILVPDWNLPKHIKNISM